MTSIMPRASRYSTNNGDEHHEFIWHVVDESKNSLHLRSSRYPYLDKMETRCWEIARLSLLRLG